MGCAEAVSVVQVQDHANLNVSHTIHKLSFGPEFPGEENPLDDFVRTVRKGEPTGTFKYFLKVRHGSALMAPGLRSLLTPPHGACHGACQLVPVQYRRLNGKVFDSHQYSVTEYFTTSKVRALLRAALERGPEALGAGERAGDARSHLLVRLFAGDAHH